MSPSSIEIVAPSRLHFGLLAPRADARRYGGVGAMIRKPEMRIRIEHASRLDVHGPACLTPRVIESVRRWTDFWKMAHEPRCRIEILTAPDQHVGLGVGTQLGLSVACGLNAYFRQPALSPLELAASVQRGQRSAVGTYGFVHGGLIVERGKLQAERIAPLDCRVPLPQSWVFVLIRPRGGRGLSGPQEQSAFEQLPRVPAEVSQRLAAEIRNHMLPAAWQGRFDEFSDSVYRYGRAAGMCFAQQHGGGPFNGPRLTSLVETVRGLGVRGVGQSSWGPTLFAILADRRSAEDFVCRLRRVTGEQELDLCLSPPDNEGARLIES